MIAIADSWEGRSSSATLDIPVSDIEIGDIIVVFTFCAGGGTGGTPTDDGANTYRDRISTTPDATFTNSVSLSDTVCGGVITQVSVSNSAGGANDVAAVVMRLTHDGTGWLHRASDNAINQTIDDPTSGPFSIDLVFSPGGAYEYVDAGTALLLAALTHDGSTTTFAPAGGWADVEEDEDAAAGIPYSVVSRVDTAHHSPNPSHQWTTGASRDYSMASVAYTERISDVESGIVVTAPSPAVLGLTLEVDNPDVYPDPNDETFHALIYDADNKIPDIVNSEIIRVVGRTGDVWDIERGQHGSMAQAIDVDWVVWRDHIYANVPYGLLAQANSYRLGAALATLGWP